MKRLPLVISHFEFLVSAFNLFTAVSIKPPFFEGLLLKVGERDIVGFVVFVAVFDKPSIAARFPELVLECCGPKLFKSNYL